MLADQLFMYIIVCQGSVLKGVDVCCICHRKHGVCIKVMLALDSVFPCNLPFDEFWDLIPLIIIKFVHGECSVAMAIVRLHSIRPVLEVQVCT